MTNVELIQNFCRDFWEQQKFDCIADYFAKDAKIFSPFNIQYGPLTMCEVAQKWLTAFPDLIFKWQEFIAQDSKVVMRWQASGTHLGSFFSTSPTHSDVTYSGVTFFTVAEGKIVEYWSLVDTHAILKQVGMQSISEAID